MSSASSMSRSTTIAAAAGSGLMTHQAFGQCVFGDIFECRGTGCIDNVELQLSSAADDINGMLGIFDPRQLNKNVVDTPSGNGGLGDAQAVEQGKDHQRNHRQESPRALESPQCPSSVTGANCRSARASAGGSTSPPVRIARSLGVAIAG